MQSADLPISYSGKNCRASLMWREGEMIYTINLRSDAVKQRIGGIFFSWFVVDKAFHSHKICPFFCFDLFVFLFSSSFVCLFVFCLLHLFSFAHFFYLHCLFVLDLLWCCLFICLFCFDFLCLFVGFALIFFVSLFVLLWFTLFVLWSVVAIHFPGLWSFLLIVPSLKMFTPLVLSERMDL